MENLLQNIDLSNSSISRAVNHFKAIDNPESLDAENLRSMQNELITTLREYDADLDNELKTKIAYIIDVISTILSSEEFTFTKEQAELLTEVFDTFAFLIADELPVYRDRQFLGAINSVLNMLQLNSPKFHEFLVRVHRETGADINKLETPLWPLILVNEINAARKVLDPNYGIKGTDGGFFEAIKEFVADDDNTFSVLADEYHNIGDGKEVPNIYLEHKRRVLRALSGPNINGFTQNFLDKAEDMVDGWEEGNEMNIVSEFDNLTFGTVLDLFIGIKDLDETSKQRITNYFKEGSQYLAQKSLAGERIGGLIGRFKDKWYEEETAFYHSVINPAIEKRIAEYDQRKINGTSKEGPKDLLDHLIEHGFAPTQIQTHIKEFMLAGQDTTSSALSSAVRRLLENPDKLETLTEELKLVAGERDHITYTDLANLPYLTRVVKETLRIDPPTHIIPRLASKNFELNGFRVYEGDVIFVSVQAIHHDDKLWTNADSFIPERPQYDETNPEAYFTFGKGERACVGKLFAEREIAIVLAYLLLNNKFELADSNINMISGTKTQRPEKLMVKAVEMEG